MENSVDSEKYATNILKPEIALDIRGKSWKFFSKFCVGINNIETNIVQNSGQSIPSKDIMDIQLSKFIRVF